MRAGAAPPGRARAPLVWSYHHLLLDGWSLGLLLKELFALYEASLRGEALAPERAPAFRDYIAWLRRQDAAEAEA